MKVLKLFRLPNLIIVALTLVLFRYSIMIPILRLEHVAPVLSNLNFALLVLSILCIAAAGYAINDYFDVRSDRINKPDKIIIGKFISRRKAIFYHTLFNIIGIMIGAYVSFVTGSLKLGVINIVCSILLWLYSLKYKAYFLVGNILVSGLTAFTILMVWLYEMTALHNNMQIVIAYRNMMMFFVWTYFGFAFMISLIREIIKDIEDIEGDKKDACSTLPVVMGIKNTKIVLYGLLLISTVALGYLAYLAKTNHLGFLFWYILLLLILPICYFTYVLITAKEKKDYAFMSNIAKYIMIAGVLSMALVFKWY